MSERKDPFSVGAWMSSNPCTVDPDVSVRSAFFTMRKGGYRHLLVCEGEKLIGVVTDRDLRRPDISEDADGWNDYYRLDEDYTVRDVMTDSPVTAKPRDPLEKALAVMLERRIGALPVLDKNGAPIGILTSTDCLRACAQVLADAGAALRK